MPPHMLHLIQGGRAAAKPAAEIPGQSELADRLAELAQTALEAARNVRLIDGTGDQLVHANSALLRVTDAWAATKRSMQTFSDEAGMAVLAGMFDELVRP